MDRPWTTRLLRRHRPSPVARDANALSVVKRFLDGEAATLPLGNQPLEPQIDGDTKVLARMTP